MCVKESQLNDIFSETLSDKAAPLWQCPPRQLLTLGSKEREVTRDRMRDLQASVGTDVDTPTGTHFISPTTERRKGQALGSSALSLGILRTFQMRVPAVTCTPGQCSE